MSNNAEELQSIVERLDAAARKTENAAQHLAVDLAESQRLAEEDRVQISRLILLVQRLTAQGEVTLSGTRRLEIGAAHVAEDLAASIVRADAAPAVLPGAGADAALRSPGETAAEVAAHADALPSFTED